MQSCIGRRVAYSGYGLSRAYVWPRLPVAWLERSAANGNPGDIQTPLRCRLIAPDPVPSAFPVDCSDVSGIRDASPVQILDLAAAGRRIVGTDRGSTVQSDTVDCPAQEGPCRLCITPGCQAESCQLTARTNRAYRIVPVQTNSVPVLVGAHGKFETDLPNPSNDSRAINRNTAFGKQISSVLSGQRAVQVHVHRTRDDACCKAMPLEQLTAAHAASRFHVSLGCLGMWCNSNAATHDQNMSLTLRGVVSGRPMLNSLVPAGSPLLSSRDHGRSVSVPLATS